jgi:hypothetical protein
MSREQQGAIPTRGDGWELRRVGRDDISRNFFPIQKGFEAAQRGDGDSQFCLYFVSNSMVGWKAFFLPGKQMSKI